LTGMKDYYAILGVRREADAIEIKRSYRKLAILYHPDKNPDASAEAFFKEINEAYEILSDHLQKAAYDTQLQYPAETQVVEEVRSAHRDPAYSRKRKHPPTYKSERQRMYDFMASYLPLTNRITQVALFVSTVLVIDFLLPTTQSDELITGTYKIQSHSRNGDNDLWVIDTDMGSEIKIPYNFSGHFELNKKIVVKSSPILKIHDSVASENVVVEIKRSLYGTFLFAPLALLFTSVFGIYHKHRVDYAFNAGVVSFMVMMLIFFIYLLIH
jgi:curved DNA-binding protein CbpA